MAVKRFCLVCVLSCVIGVGMSASTFAASDQAVPGGEQAGAVDSPLQNRTANLIRQMNQYGFHEDEISAVREMMDMSSGEIKVVEPVIEKVYEGMAKGIDNQRIVSAVKQVRTRYREAYRQAELLSKEPEQTQMLGELIAESFAAGLMPEDCQRIVQQLRQKVRSTERKQEYELPEATMLAARNLARSRVGSEIIADLLSGALQQHYEAQQMSQLQQRFQSRARYDSAETVARSFSEDIGRGLSADQLGGESGRDDDNGNGSGSGRTAGKSSDNAGAGAANNSENSTGSGGAGSDGSSGGSDKSGNGSSSGAGSDNSSAESGSGNQAGGANTSAGGSGHGHGGEAGKKK